MPDAANTERNRTAAPVAALRRFAREPKQVRAPVEHCELCADAIPSEHHHLLDLSTNAVICVCYACSVLFNNQGAAGGKYRLVSRRYLTLPYFQMTEEQWDELLIPVDMVYIFKASERDDTAAENAEGKSVARHRPTHTQGDSAEGRGDARHRSTPGIAAILKARAFYPSPAGAVESLLSLESWETLVRDNPILDELEPDVEALLINRVRDACEYFIVPIDACYRLVGLLRTSWRGLHGGDEVWKAIDEFFGNVRAKAQPVRGGTDASA